MTKIANGQPNNKLQGAQFSILDEDKKVVIDHDGNELKGLTTDKEGQVIVPDLRPGKYYFEETLAPQGYTIKTKLTEFEIVKNEETAVTIENYRYVGGGGGGGTPPVGPNPTTPPVDPDKEIDPGENPDPTQPEEPKPGTEEPKPEPEKPTKPTKPTDKVPATNKKPIKGKVEVPKDSTPKISKNPKHGKVTVDSKGNWVYTPDSGFEGKDSFKVKVTDALGNEVEYEVSVDVLHGTDGASHVANNGKLLPKTGESSLLPFQLTGLALIALGAVLYFLRKRQLQHK
ncbi:SpaA isopeptide-forming pilin-related protein [Paenibacillus sp. D2_2]|uniref:SpaA isopeptide-forming pilin-related protein n=1 Tax=Paenibacillus sp. D2_2 TaxID=3073092 RepID=UPI002815B688|nr:SpaA isopeptide-forming pilin-related protein [Paenibacillus sp. D2_2]WMT41383.1 SpaA isopeptide-forming pilin-related protein [Paenibacillus sp. D2_2]